MHARWNTFLCVAEERSLTKAAERLGYTQSGVSHLISALEEDLQLTLFRRSRSGTELTAEGEQLLPYARKLVYAAEDMERLAANLRGLEWGRIRIGSFSSVTINWLPEILKLFSRRYPNIEIEVHNGAYAVIEEELAANRTDCSFLTAPANPDIQFTPLCDDRYFVLMPETAARKWGREVELKSLQDKPFIIPAEGTRYDIGKIFKEAGVEMKIKYDMGDDYAAVEMVRRGFGFTILPELLLQNMPLNGVHTAMLKRYKRTIGIACGKERYQPKVVSAFVQCVKEYLCRKGGDEAAVQEKPKRRKTLCADLEEM